jgi:D-mannonate dehydratase
MTLYNLMISGFPNTIYGRPGRDEEIEKVIQSIRVAGRCGLPVVEYNFYAYRLVEGYYEELGRGGAGLTAYTYDKVKDLPPPPEIGVHSLDEMWKNITYFLKAVIPEAEKAGVRMALHPNDPPVPLSRGSGQIMATLEGWKKLVSIVPSPSNGITYDCGVTKELGEDPVEVFRYFMQRKAVNHMHYRNVRVRKPYVDYTEVFPDEGEVDMFAVMKEVVRLRAPARPRHRPRTAGLQALLSRRRLLRRLRLQRRLHARDAPGGDGERDVTIRNAWLRTARQVYLFPNGRFQPRGISPGEKLTGLPMPEVFSRMPSTRDILISSRLCS